MKCNIKNGRIVPKKTIPEVIDLNECLYHGIGTYLVPQQKLNRLRAILDSNAILSENLQSSDFAFHNQRSRSPKCNGKNHISICQKPSFIEPLKTSESYNCFVSSGLSIILDKSILDNPSTINEFNPKHISDWLDGEYRVRDKINSSYFVGIGIPSSSLEDVAQSFKNLRHFTLRESIEYVLNSDWFKDLSAIKSYMSYNDIELPIYSIVSGKQMGNLYSAFASAYNVNPNEVSELCGSLRQQDSPNPHQFRVGTIRNWKSSWEPTDFEDTFSK